MRIRTAGFCAIAVAAAASANAQAPSTVSPAQAVLARQAAMGMSGGILTYLSKAADAGVEVKTLGYEAYTLDAWAKALPSLFPTGTAAADVKVRNRSKPEIWSDPSGFAAAANAFADSTARLRDIAKQNDAGAFKAQVKDIENRCNACHAAYRSGPA